MAQPIPEREWLRPKQAADYLGVSVSTLYGWRKRGLVKFYQIGPRAVALRRRELDELSDATPAGPPPDDDGFDAVIAINEALHTKYGLFSDSTPVIRRERDER
ncbi:MAG TPA: helix-turn-helix domain-containing protein [Armatimonadota bacterium]|jgi:excisionase family DNA binding protein|nr:helix-turn-helix domain-containing protein [Armatimonadota bacterium]